MVPVVLSVHHLLTFSTGRGYYRYPGVDWTLVVTGPSPNSISRVLVSPNFWLTVTISLDVTVTGQQRLDSGSPPAGWFPLPDAVVEAFGLPPICPPQSVFDVP